MLSKNIYPQNIQVRFNFFSGDNVAILYEGKNGDGDVHGRLERESQEPVVGDEQTESPRVLSIPPTVNSDSSPVRTSSKGTSPETLPRDNPSQILSHGSSADSVSAESEVIMPGNDDNTPERKKSSELSQSLNREASEGRLSSVEVNQDAYLGRQTLRLSTIELRSRYV